MPVDLPGTRIAPAAIEVIATVVRDAVTPGRTRLAAAFGAIEMTAARSGRDDAPEIQFVASVCEFSSAARSGDPELKVRRFCSAEQ